MKLYQFLKWHGLASTGGEAKHLISSGLITVNGSIETRRGRQLIPGDKISFGNDQLVMTDTDISKP